MIINQRIQQITDLYISSKASLQAKESEALDCEQQLQITENELDLLEQCTSVFREVAEGRRAALKHRLEKLLSFGLQVVFREKLRVTVEYKKWGSGDRVQILVSDSWAEAEIQKFRGGALTEVVSFLIRILMLVLYKPAQRRLFIADEIFGAVSVEHLDDLSLLLKELSTKLGFQLVLVTHNSMLADHADCAYIASKINGELNLKRYQDG